MPTEIIKYVYVQSKLHAETSKLVINQNMPYIEQTKDEKKNKLKFGRLAIIENYSYEYKNNEKNP